MTTNYLVPITSRGLEILIGYHLTGCHVAGEDWEAYRLHQQRIDELTTKAPTGFVALDQAEFELLGEPVPA